MIVKNRIKAVVFDCDGVMFDTADANRAYYDEVLAGFNRPSLTKEQFEKVHMSTVKEAIAFLFPDVSDLETVFRHLKQIGYNKFIKYMKMEEGLVSLLEGLERKGIIRAVATNRTDTMQKVLLDYQLASEFDMVVTAADVKKPKPDPEQLQRIMAAFDLEPDQVVFIGDSLYDEQAARGAGTWFVAFKNSLLNADLHVDSMAGIAIFLGVK